jgi:Holliday junction resolvase-like predicted endonuclease
MKYILVLNKEKDEITKVEVAEFSEERKLQDIIKRYPEVLSIPTNGSIVPLVTEYPTNTGSVDLIAFDEGGKIYVIETKLHRNYDKRKALAQLIDYASQIAMHETFEDFKEKVRRVTGRTFEEIVKERFGEEYEQILDRLKTAFNGEDFALVLVMDELDAPLKDMILFLNRHSDLNIIGVELRRFILNEKTEVFVPTVVGIEVPRKEDRSRLPELPITEKEFIERYTQAGVGEIAEKIIHSFKVAEERFDKVKIVQTPKYFNLKIRDGEIDISINANPKGDHGVWVKNRNLYEAVKQIGDNLELETNIPRSERFGKVIIFNGIDGLRNIVDRLDRLIEELVNVKTGEEQQEV